MKNPELGRSKATWRDLFALGVLKDAKCILQQIESAAKNGDDALKWHLWIAFIVSYSKPFTANGDMGRISDGLIPQVFSDLHTAFIKTRDKLYAHTDPLESLDDGAQANQIFVIKAGDTIEIIPHTLRLDDAEIARAMQLICHIIEGLQKATKDGNEHIKTQLKDKPDGPYLFPYPNLTQ